MAKKIIFMILFVSLGLTCVGASFLPLGEASGQEISSFPIISLLGQNLGNDNGLVNVIEAVFNSTTPYSSYGFWDGMVYFIVAFAICASICLQGILVAVALVFTIISVVREDESEKKFFAGYIGTLLLTCGVGGLFYMSSAGFITLSFFGRVSLYCAGAWILLMYLFIQCTRMRKMARGLIVNNQLSRLAIIGLSILLMKITFDTMIILRPSPVDFIVMAVSLLTFPMVISCGVCWKGNRLADRLHIAGLIINHCYVLVAYILATNKGEIAHTGFAVFGTVLLVVICIAYLSGFDIFSNIIIKNMATESDIAESLTGYDLYLVATREYCVDIFPAKDYFHLFLKLVGGALGSGLACAIINGLILGLNKICGWTDIEAMNIWSVCLGFLAVIPVVIYFIQEVSIDIESGTYKGPNITMVFFPLLVLCVAGFVAICSSMSWNPKELQFPWQWAVFCTTAGGIIISGEIVLYALFRRCAYCGLIETKDEIDVETFSNLVHDIETVPEKREVENNVYYEDYGNTEVHEEITYITPAHKIDHGWYEDIKTVVKYECCFCKHRTRETFYSQKRL